MPLFAFAAFFVFTRRLMPRFGEVLIAAATVTALGDQYALPSERQISYGLAGFLVECDGADWHPQDHVVASVTSAVRTFAVASTIRLELAVVAITQQGIVVQIRLEIHTAAI